jgi:signal transduction histidine kinase
VHRSGAGESLAQSTAIELASAPELEGLFDDGQLTQVIVNLLLNALDASTHDSPVKMQAKQEGEFIEVIVSDQGPGLNPEQQEHLFEAFYSTKRHGTGLGLAVSRELMRAQKGDVVYCPGTRGAAFAVRIPAVQYVEI